QPDNPQPSDGGGSAQQSSDGVPGGGSGQGTEAEHFSHATIAEALAKAYGRYCRALRTRGRRAFNACVNALARLAGGETRSPRRACRSESRRRVRGRRHSDFGECVAAGRKLLARLRAGAKMSAAGRG